MVNVKCPCVRSSRSPTNNLSFKKALVAYCREAGLPHEGLDSATVEVSDKMPTDFKGAGSGSIPHH